MNVEQNDAMMELFRSEVESHSEALTASLLAWEQDSTTPATLERMMRAAHSIKGAARIMNVSPAVEVAHAMEDCCVAAQKGNVKLTSDGVDVLLRSVDLLIQIAAATRNPQPDWSGLETAVHSAVVDLQGVLRGAPLPSAAARAGPLVDPPPPATPIAVAAPTPPSNTATTIIVGPPIFDAPAAEIARRQLLAALESSTAEIHLDLTATRDLDAIGLGFLAAAQQHAARRSRILRFRPISPEMREVLQVVGLDAASTEVAAP